MAGNRQNKTNRPQETCLLKSRKFYAENTPFSRVRQKIGFSLHLKICQSRAAVLEVFSHVTLAINIQSDILEYTEEYGGENETFADADPAGRRSLAVRQCRSFPWGRTDRGAGLHGEDPDGRGNHHHDSDAGALSR